LAAIAGLAVAPLATPKAITSMAVDTYWRDIERIRKAGSLRLSIGFSTGNDAYLTAKCEMKSHTFWAFDKNHDALVSKVADTAEWLSKRSGLEAAEKAQ
jgi:hypothetical protein